MLPFAHVFSYSGSLLSPAHGATVRERYRTNPSEILPSPHRLAVAQLLVQNSKLLSVDPWEITRRRYVVACCCCVVCFCLYCMLCETTRASYYLLFPGICCVERDTKWAPFVTICLISRSPVIYSNITYLPIYFSFFS